MGKPSVKKSLQKIHDSFGRKSFSVNSLAKFLFPFDWKHNKKKAQIEAAEIVRAGISSHYQILEYPSVLVSGRGGVNKITSDNILSYKRQVFFKIKDILENKEDLAVYTFLKENTKVSYSIEAVLENVEYTESVVRKVLNRLVILNFIQTEQLSGHKNIYFIRKKEEFILTQKEMKKKSKIELLQFLFKEVGYESFSIQYAQSILFPEGANVEDLGLTVKLIVKGCTNYQLFNYRDKEVSSLFGGITYVAGVDWLTFLDRSVFVFKNSDQSLLDTKIREKINYTVFKTAGYTKKDVVDHFPEKGEVTIYRALTRLFITGRLELTKDKKYIISDGRAKIALKDHDTKVDQAVIYQTQQLLLHVVTNLKQVRDTFQDRGLRYVTLAEITDVIVANIIEQQSSSPKEVFKKLMEEYHFYISNQVKIFMEKALRYKVFKLTSHPDTRYDIVCKDMNVSDLEFLESVDLQEGQKYTLGQIAKRSSVNTVDKISYILIRLRVSGILGEVYSTKNKAVPLYVFTPPTYSKQGPPKITDRIYTKLSTESINVQEEYADEDSFEESMEGDSKEKEITKVILPKPIVRKKHSFSWTRKLLSNLKSFYSTIDHNSTVINFEINQLLLDYLFFHLSSRALPPTLLENAKAYLLDNDLLMLVLGGKYSFTTDAFYDQDHKVMYKLYDQFGTSLFTEKEALTFLRSSSGLPHRFNTESSLIRLWLDNRLVSPISSAATMSYRVSSTIKAPSATPSYEKNPIVYFKDTEAEEPCSSKETPGQEKVSLDVIMSPENTINLSSENPGLFSYVLNTEDPQEQIICEDFIHRFSSEPQVQILGRKQNKLVLALLSKLSKQEFKEKVTYNIYSLDFSLPHNFKQDVIGDNTTEGFLLKEISSEKSEFQILFVPCSIPFLEK